MKLFTIILALSTVPAMAADMSAAKIPGYIADSKCGATHNSSSPNASCVKKIDDPDVVKDHYGHHVAVIGKVDEADKTIHIATVSMLADQGKPSGPSEMH
jgi:hypothetical protein